MELLIGCGGKREKVLAGPGGEQWKSLVTLDINPNHRPDVVWDLEEMPYPFSDDLFDEVHAYEVLEHIGAQGDWKTFFRQFSELWRILKPGGLLLATVPSFDSQWAWGDPSHRRVFTPGTLSFLSQAEYAKQVGVTPMSDFRFFYKADFQAVFIQTNGGTFSFALSAVKPARVKHDAI